MWITDSGSHKKNGEMEISYLRAPVCFHNQDKSVDHLSGGGGAGFLLAFTLVCPHPKKARVLSMFHDSGVFQAGAVIPCAEER